jgi:hypothetical protein
MVVVLFLSLAIKKAREGHVRTLPWLPLSGLPRRRPNFYHEGNNIA